MEQVTINPEIKKIGISHNDGILFKNISELVYSESDENYSKLHFSNGESYLVSKTLKDLQNTLEPYKVFFRIHKKSLINLNYVSHYRKVNGQFVIILDNKTELGVACRRRNDFLKQIPKV